MWPYLSGTAPSLSYRPPNFKFNSLLKAYLFVLTHRFSRISCSSTLILLKMHENNKPYVFEPHFSCENIPSN